MLSSSSTPVQKKPNAWVRFKRGIIWGGTKILPQLNSAVGSGLNLLGSFIEKAVVQWVGLGFNFAVNVGSIATGIHHYRRNRRLAIELEKDYGVTPLEIYEKRDQRFILKSLLAFNITFDAASTSLLIWISTLVAEEQHETQQEQRYAIVVALLLFSVGHSLSMYGFRRDYLALQGAKSQQVASLKRLDNIPMLRDKLIIGDYREQLLTSIDQEFSKEHPGIPVLIGPIGMGKSNLACFYVQSHQRQRYLDNDSHLQARLLSIDDGDNLIQQQSLEKSFRTLAKALNLPQQAKNLEELIAHVYDYLGKLTAKVLLIFDNVQTPHVIKSFLPPFDVRNVHILLLSSNQCDWSQPFKPIVIAPDELAEEAFTLLKNCWNAQSYVPTDTELKELLVCIGHNPLAVMSVAKDIQRKQQSIGEYLVDLPTYIAEEPIDEHEQVFSRLQAFWKMSLQNLRTPALKALQLCAYLHHSDIPKSLLKDIQWPLVMPSLSQYSICETRVNGDKPYYHHLQIDRLFQTFLLSYFKAARRESLLTLVASLESVFELDNTLTESFLRHAALLPHVERVMWHWQQQPLADISPAQQLTYIQLLLKWANHMIQSQMYVAAEKVLAEAKKLLLPHDLQNAEEQHQELKRTGAGYVLAYARACHYMGKCYYHTRQQPAELYDEKVGEMHDVHANASRAALQEGLTMLERLREYDASPALGTEMRIYQRILALNLAESGQLKEAEQLLFKTRDSGDALNSSICNYFLAELYLNQKRYTEAKFCIQSAINTLERSTKGHWRLGDYYQRQAFILEKLGAHREAHAVWQKVLASTPQHKLVSVEKAFSDFTARNLAFFRASNTAVLDFPRESEEKIALQLDMFSPARERVGESLAENSLPVLNVTAHTRKSVHT